MTDADTLSDQEMTMNAVTTRAEARPLPTHAMSPEAGGLLEVISRAASDPTVNVENLGKLMDLYERISDRGAKAEFTQALATMQPLLPVITENGAISTDKGQTVQSTFARWEDINDAIRPILADHGFALNFKPGRAGDQVLVTGVLSHIGGHSEEATVTLGLDGSGSKNNVQAVGSSISYGKRYAAISLLNITSRAPADRDDDGHNAELSAAVAAAYASIDMCMSPADCAEWKMKNMASLDKLQRDDRAKVVAYFNTRARKVKAQAPAPQCDPADDFPGDRK